MQTITATVTSLRRGRNGPFAIAVSDAMTGSITFSLKPPVWAERREPHPGDIVRLTDLRQKASGWRAMAGAFSSPKDDA